MNHGKQEGFQETPAELIASCIYERTLIGLFGAKEIF